MFIGCDLFWQFAWGLGGFFLGFFLVADSIGFEFTSDNHIHNFEQDEETKGNKQNDEIMASIVEKAYITHDDSKLRWCFLYIKFIIINFEYLRQKQVVRVPEPIQEVIENGRVIHIQKHQEKQQLEIVNDAIDQIPIVQDNVHHYQNAQHNWDNLPIHLKPLPFLYLGLFVVIEGGQNGCGVDVL